jgi:hypothetical protein
LREAVKIIIILICKNIRKNYDIIHTKERTATSLIGKLIQMDFLESDTPKSAIRLKFNAHFASYIFPELIPQK